MKKISIFALIVALIISTAACAKSPTIPSTIRAYYGRNMSFEYDGYSIDDYGKTVYFVNLDDKYCIAFGFIPEGRYEWNDLIEPCIEIARGDDTEDEVEVTELIDNSDNATVRFVYGEDDLVKHGYMHLFFDDTNTYIVAVAAISKREIDKKIFDTIEQVEESLFLHES